MKTTLTSGRLQRILIGTRGNLKRLILWVVAQPTPAGALNADRRCNQFLLERIEATKVLADFGAKIVGDFR